MTVNKVLFAFFDWCITRRDVLLSTVKYTILASGGLAFYLWGAWCAVFVIVITTAVFVLSLGFAIAAANEEER